MILFIYLKLQTGFSRRVSQCFDSSVVAKSIAIEGNRFDTGFLSFFGDHLSDHHCRLAITAVRKFCLGGTGGGKRFARQIIHYLCIYMGEASIDGQPWALRRADNAFADTNLASRSSLGFLTHFVHRLLLSIRLMQSKAK